MLKELLSWLSLSSVIFLIFMFGVVASVENTLFYVKTKEVFDYIEALGKPDEEYSHWLWAKDPEHKQGVTRSDARAYDKGLTFFTTNFAQAFLVDMDGHILHQWHLPADQAFPDEGALDQKEKETDKRAYWMEAHVFANGDLIAVYQVPRLAYGRGLVKMDKDSHVLWAFDAHAHHSLDVDPAGNVYTLTEILDGKNTYKIDKLDKLLPPYVDMFVTILNPDGQSVKDISLIQAFQHSEYAGLLSLSLLKDNDILHANKVRYIDAKTAARFPFAKEGDLLISLRNIDTIAVLDPRKEVITWAMTGSWRGQHDPSMLENGHMLLFDNHCVEDEKCFPPGTNVVEFDPSTGNRFWVYDGKETGGLNSPVQGTVQRLPNGNTMVVESLQGRILEVTPQKEIAWEYYNPLRGGPNKEFRGSINYARRFPEDAFTFLKADAKK